MLKDGDPKEPGSDYINANIIMVSMFIFLAYYFTMSLFKDRFLRRAGKTNFLDSISQWLPCRLTIWNLLLWIAILLN